MTETGSKRRRRKTSRTVCEQEKLSKREFLGKLRNLADHWDTHNQADLALRHETGTLLNFYYGDPTKRQSRGEKVMKEAAKALSKTEAELSQLRRFAFHFKSVQAMKRRHPSVTTWTQVRDLLPRLRQRNRGKKTRGRKAAPAQLRLITASLTTLVSALARPKFRPSQEEVEKVVAKFQEVVQAVPAWRPVRIVFTKMSSRKAS